MPIPDRISGRLCLVLDEKDTDRNYRILISSAPLHRTGVSPSSFSRLLCHTLSMRQYWLALSVCSLWLLATQNATAGRFPRDVSGDAMQQYDSRLLSSPMIRFPSLLGLSYWPFVPYPPAPSMPVFNIVIESSVEPSAPPPAKLPAPAKFWIARCGTIVEIDVAKTNLLEEEGKDCTP
jgi:hypothetical protein